MAEKGNLVIQAFDRLAFQIIEALHRLFGFQYSKNNEFYIYQDDVDTTTQATAGALYTSSVRMTQESDFVCTRVNCFARRFHEDTPTNAGHGGIIGMSAQTPAAGDAPDAPFLIQLTDGSTDRILMNTPVDAALAFGTWGSLPGIWPKPRLFARNSNIGIQYTLQKSIPEYFYWTLYCQFIGWKIFDLDAQNLTSRRS